MSDPSQALPALLKGALGDSYTIEGEIGRGGMGVVYRARDERLQRRVAVKVLPPELAFSSEIRQRFTREAQTAARLSHPHIVPIHDVGEGNGVVYFVMGLIEGESLAARIRRRSRIPAEEARRIMRETADALSAAHALSIIHRDIKPDNILLEGTRGRVMVTDFGIAKALSATSGATLTSAGMAIGTPAYMSPEQAAGEREVDGRSDLYSVGIVAYQMLSGELPFNAPTVAGILMKQITETAPLLHEQFPDVPEDLSLAVARCLEKDPENRWPSADALRRSLESRTVAGYRPTGLGWKAQTREAGSTARPVPTRNGRTTPERTTPTRSGRTSERASTVRPTTPGRPPRPVLQNRVAQGGLGGPNDLQSHQRMARGDQKQRRRDERMARRGKNDTPLPNTGEPQIVLRVRRDFSRWAVLTGGTFAINMAFMGGPHNPWFLIVSAVSGWSLLKHYSDLWQAGYSWRDVLNRPDAPDSVGSGNKQPRIKGVKLVGEPKAAEYGAYYDRMQQVYKDRSVIISLMGQLSAADKEMLPDIVDTTESLYARAAQLAQTLGSMDTLDTPRIEARLAELQQRPAGEERDRQISLLESQLQRCREINGQKTQFADRFESCVLAMQNVRLDLMRLKQSGIGSVINGLTNATQQARALSRDVDHAIDAAVEVREL
ncbi:MAG TPA: serine/threonine-protein kinase [Gemmatimonadales bacterium]|jgi:serine/threonine-protein kinase